ncbi:MAG: LysR family transcriptional regulator [Marivita sp.]|uniref:helix-turn-helix domain-containing protein n=1 Tax=Marivita sp. TaxID=2003365 RepID=UPI001B0AD2F7|nr:LysR family transcriptional regulator [Marivita sp.]MBO6883754.1 LysR family transcriptional regulator [Marivita sp.]
MPAPDANILMNRLLLKGKVRHMLVLVRLIELGSMRRTATALNMAQPAVTQIVAEMEALLETELFFRHARGVEPTEAAKDLLPVAHRKRSATPTLTA